MAREEGPALDLVTLGSTCSLVPRERHRGSECSVCRCGPQGLVVRCAAVPFLLDASAVGTPSVLQGGKDVVQESRRWSETGCGAWGRACDRSKAFVLFPWLLNKQAWRPQTKEVRGWL